MAITSTRIFSLFSGERAGTTLPALVRKLLAEQKRSWAGLSTGYAALASVRTRDVPCSGFVIALQFNPRRIVSTAADTSADAIRRRPCFLCIENLPDPQKAILYHDRFLILCNPAPIFPEHLTISSTVHEPQSIGSKFGVMLDLAKDMSPDYVLYYNGPRCGASAPDHLHFQAGPAGVTPVERDAEKKQEFLRRFENVDLGVLRSYGRTVLAAETDSKEGMSRFFSSFVKQWQHTVGSDEEPMMNLLCGFGSKKWRLILFPRSKHRPDAYHKEGEARILISPAAIDMAGLVITPVEKDFLHVDAPTVEGIYNEVSFPEKNLSEIVAAL